MFYEFATITKQFFLSCRVSEDETPNVYFAYFFTYLLPQAIGPFRFQAGGRKRRPNLAAVFWCLFCNSIFGYGCMFTFVVFVLVFQYYGKRLAGKNVSEMTYFCVVWDVKHQLLLSCAFGVADRRSASVVGLNQLR